jgi:hypothetical protein
MNATASYYKNQLADLPEGTVIEVMPAGGGRWETEFSKHILLSPDVDARDFPDDWDSGIVYVRRAIHATARSGRLADILVEDTGNLYIRWYKSPISGEWPEERNTTNCHELASFEVLQ